MDLADKIALGILIWCSVSCIFAVAWCGKGDENWNNRSKNKVMK